MRDLFRLTWILLPLALGSCGLIGDDQNEEDKLEIITFVDDNFKTFCLKNYDTNSDGKLSVYEARFARNMDCSGLDIQDMSEINYFDLLITLDCSNNDLTELTPTKCLNLTSIDCSENRKLTNLDLENLSLLASLKCNSNSLYRLSFVQKGSLSKIECSDNKLSILDLSDCATTIDILNTRHNSELSTIYLTQLQSDNIKMVNIDGHTKLSIR